MVCFPSATEEQTEAMTFQIGIAAPVAIILGSDQKQTSLYGIRHSSMSPKIHISASGSFGYCSAGDVNYSNLLIAEVERAKNKSTVDFAGANASNLLAIQDILTKCAIKAKRKHARSMRAQNADKVHFGNTLFVFRNDQTCRLWCVDSSPSVPSASMVISSYVKAGDANTSAVFFPEHYINYVDDDLDGLISLAVHTVLMAKSEYVDGVEVGVFSSERFEILSESELKPYIERSKALDAEILAKLRKPRQ